MVPLGALFVLIFSEELEGFVGNKAVSLKNTKWKLEFWGGQFQGFFFPLKVRAMIYAKPKSLFLHSFVM